ncbi:L-lactate dehydrogenase, partial [candidate division KSB1 bacterium]|nr:L-lactate dehydrogenase [candidate division KSB1 bacterium]
MSKIAIIGVGDVGATLAYTVQLSGLVTEIVLIDLEKARVNGHALDMNHGLFFTPSVNIYAGDISDCYGAAVVIIAAGARQKSGETRLELVQRNAAICKKIVEQVVPHINDETVFLVTTNPVDIMTYVTFKASGLSHQKVIGSGTLLDSSRFRYALSKHCNVDAKNVHAYVIGEHGDSEVLLWSLVNISGIKLEDFCKGCKTKCQGPPIKEIETEVRESAYHIIAAKGFTNYGVSLAILRIMSAI